MMRRTEDHYGNTARKPAPVEDLPLFSSEPAPAWHATGTRRAPPFARPSLDG